MTKTVIFYNQWEGINDEELKKSFILLSDAEVVDLKIGSEVWFFDDFIDPRGKVYGYSPITITALERKGAETIVHYDDDNSSGFVSISTPNRTARKRV